MYKFYMAHCINEIVCRYRVNQDKRKTINSLKDQLIPLVADPTATPAPVQEIKINDLYEQLVHKFGEYEAQRIRDFFEKNEIESLTFDDALMGVTQLFDEDLDEIIAQCFDKLDINDEATLTVKYIRQGLLVNARTHVNPILKTHNKALLKYVYDMKSTRTFGKVEFGQYIRTCLN